MMNKKMMALLFAVSTISTSMFALLGDIVEGTFDAAGSVATVPVDAVDATFDRNETYSDKRRARYDNLEERNADRGDRIDARRNRRHYHND